MSSEGCGKEALRRLNSHCEMGGGLQGAGECPEANGGGGELLITEGTGEMVQSNLQSLYFKYEETEGQRGPWLSETHQCFPGEQESIRDVHTWFSPREEQFHSVRFHSLRFRKAGTLEELCWSPTP